MKYLVTVEEVTPDIRINLSDAIKRVKTDYIQQSLSLSGTENRIRATLLLRNLTDLDGPDSRFLVEQLVFKQKYDKSRNLYRRAQD